MTKQLTASRPITIGDPRLAAWRSFLRAHARVMRALEHELATETGMTLSDYDVMVQLALSDERKLRMSELADAVLISRSGITRLVDRLESDGLIQRVSCETDRRGQWAWLTDAGMERMRTATPIHLRGVAEHFLERLSADDLAALDRMLEPIGSEPER